MSGLARDPRSDSRAGSTAPEIAFLAHHGVTPSGLAAATATARRLAISADAALLASGMLSETHFYRSLARHLRLPFVDGDVPIAKTARYPETIHAGLAPLDSDPPAYLVAPRGAAIAYLIVAAAQGRLAGRLGGRLGITTPTHLAELLRHAFHGRIAYTASFGLSVFDPAFSVRHETRWHPPFAVAALSLLGSVATVFAAAGTLQCAIALGIVFLSAVILRLFACASAVEAQPRAPPELSDDALPLYSIVIALYREAAMVPQLVDVMRRLDYPKAKLDIKFVIEEDDFETFAALRPLVRSPSEQIIVAPAGMPRTKPRALNVALPLLCGQFVAVYDAEDIPDPRQLRKAAAHFVHAAPEIACLQARLAIDNLSDGWLPQLFAVEYAALFDVINIGLADLRLPFPLGGSSNHFRTDVLRKLGGWDAWNVTEDADIGFRLVRFGYCAQTLDSTTFEEAPVRAGAFLGQRRRWCKGWYQTLITLCRHPSRLIREVGITRGAAMVMILLSSVLAPLGGPFGIVMLARTVLQGGPFWPTSPFDIIVATLATSVFSAGLVSLGWPIFLGMKRRRLLALWPSLLLLPAYYGLISIAAWTSLYDLMTRPYHWCKTQHGLARSRQPPVLEDIGGDPPCHIDAPPQVS